MVVNSWRSRERFLGATGYPWILGTARRGDPSSRRWKGLLAFDPALLCVRLLALSESEKAGGDVFTRLVSSVLY